MRPFCGHRSITWVTNRRWVGVIGISSWSYVGENVVSNRSFATRRRSSNHDRRSIEPSRFSGSVSPALASPRLLQNPGVPVGVAEVGERVVVAMRGIRARQPLPRLEVPDIAHFHPAIDEL